MPQNPKNNVYVYIPYSIGFMPLLLSMVVPNMNRVNYILWTLEWLLGQAQTPASQCIHTIRKCHRILENVHRNLIINRAHVPIKGNGCTKYEQNPFNSVGCRVVTKTGRMDGRTDRRTDRLSRTRQYPQLTKSNNYKHIMNFITLIEQNRCYPFYKYTQISTFHTHLEAMV